VWRIDPAGWLYLVLISGWNLLSVALSVLRSFNHQRIHISAFIPALVINAAILLYCLLPSTKRACGSPLAIG
jgi:hypothetical protein